MSTVFEFRLRVAPRWDVIVPKLQERARQIGLVWPGSVRPLQFAKMYAVSLTGEQHSRGDGLTSKFNVLAWEPPKEPVVAENLTDFSTLHIPLGVRQPKAWRAANPGRDIDPHILAPVLTGDGLVVMDAHASQTLADIPYQAILHVMAAVAGKKIKLKVMHSDHIVEHLAVPAELSAYKLSRWRGDPSYRLSHPGVDLEVWVKPRG